VALKPTITPRGDYGDYGEATVRHLVERAHDRCFISNSVRTAINVDATIASASA
jgi:organic hydroperoxide reductase OsmC/OhrA